MSIVSRAYYRHSSPPTDFQQQHQQVSIREEDQITTLLNDEDSLQSSSIDKRGIKKDDNGKERTKKARGLTIHHSKISSNNNTCDSSSVVLSAIYCKLLVVIGLALPITQVTSNAVPLAFYNGFYIYLYSASIIFIIIIHFIRLKGVHLIKQLFTTEKFQEEVEDTPRIKRQQKEEQKINNYGSFYLRLGAAAFGLGSMVYSGLEFGEYFVSGNHQLDCQNSGSAIKPALRIAFTILQLHFIFLSDNSMDTINNQMILRISLAHMLACNLSEWLSLIVEETKHEIEHLHPPISKNNTSTGDSETAIDPDCVSKDKVGILMRSANSYLFPCTIEYSLICAVTLVEMWKDVKIEAKKNTIKQSRQQNRQQLKKSSTPSGRGGSNGNGSGGGGHEYSVDCSHSEKGLVFGLLITAYTLVSLVVQFSLRGSSGSFGAILICEAIIHLSSLVAIAVAALQMRHLPYCVHRLSTEGSLRLGLDITLLLKAQFGIYMYNMFSFLACLLSSSMVAPVWPDLLSLLQTTAQTIFILDVWWKRCGKWEDEDSKPGREMVTYLRVANMALWIINITENNRAQLRPIHLEFFGTLAWTIITHISMPLAIFYRFHSAICLFEIWRNSYKTVTAMGETQPLFV